MTDGEQRERTILGGLLLFGDAAFIYHLVHHEGHGWEPWALAAGVAFTGLYFVVPMTMAGLWTTMRNSFFFLEDTEHTGGEENADEEQSDR